MLKALGGAAFALFFLPLLAASLLIALARALAQPLGARLGHPPGCLCRACAPALSARLDPSPFRAGRTTTDGGSPAPCSLRRPVLHPRRIARAQPGASGD